VKWLWPSLVVYALIWLGVSAFVRVGFVGGGFEWDVLYGIIMISVAGGLLVAAALVVIRVVRTVPPVERTAAVVAARWGVAASNALAGGVMMSRGPLRPSWGWHWGGFVVGALALGLVTFVVAFIAELVGLLLPKNYIYTGCCPKCGYDLRVQFRAGRNRCPECGTVIDAELQGPDENDSN